MGRTLGPLLNEAHITSRATAGPDPAISMGKAALFGSGWPVEPAHDNESYAARASLAFSAAKAQSSHGVSASTSEVSTVAPHQIRRPGGASR